MPQVAPLVLNRFQNSENRITGRLADAAMANAIATRKATFNDCAGMANAIDTAPMQTAEIRPTLTSCLSVTCPFLITLEYRSCANDDEAASVRPATTARMVAKATAAITASMTAPSPVPTPPSASASCGAAVLPPGLCADIALDPTSAAAPKPRASVIR